MFLPNIGRDKPKSLSRLLGNFANGVNHMENMQVSREGNTLVIKVDIAPETIAKARMSSTGKSKLVASSHGFQRVNCADNMAISLNLSAR
jgi:hypothetical protein